MNQTDFLSGELQLSIPSMGLPGGTVVKNSPEMQETLETPVSSLGSKDPLE